MLQHYIRHVFLVGLVFVGPCSARSQGALGAQVVVQRAECDRLVPSLPLADMIHIVNEQLPYEKIKDSEAPVLQPGAANDLNLVKPKKEGGSCLLDEVGKYLCTAFGRRCLAMYLQNPTSDAERLEQVQKFIRYLVERQDSLDKISQALMKAQVAQSNVLMLNSPKNSIEAHGDMLATLSGVTGMGNSQSVINLTRIGLSTFCGVATGMDIFLSGTFFLGLIGLINADLMYASKNELGTNLVVGGMTALANWVTFWKLGPALLRQERNSRTMQELLIDVSTMVSVVKDIYPLVKKLPNSSKVLRYYNELVAYATRAESLGADVRALLDQLSTPTFKGSASYFSNMGRVRALYQKVLELRSALVPLQEVIGEIDMFVAIARLMVHEQGYCFSTFIKGASVPVLDVRECKSPLIKSKNIVGETIRLGDGGVPNILLTGPHGGGKTTFMRALAYAVILSQIFGIAPCKECKLTVYARLNTYLDLEDNPKKGMSTFMMEHQRVKDIKHRILNLRGNQFGFTVMDEVFKGTMENEAARLIVRFGERVANVMQNICILATHFIEPALKLDIEADQNNRFVNYHMSVEETLRGRFERGFTLVKGICEWWFSDPEKRFRYIKDLRSAVAE